jgi:hypothetical protein
VNISFFSSFIFYVESERARERIAETQLYYCRFADLVRNKSNLPFPSGGC